MPKKKKTGTLGEPMRKATREERIAVRATGARKVARKEGELTAIYSPEKGGRLVTSRNSGRFSKPTETNRTKGLKSTADRYGGVASRRNQQFRETLSGSENSDFYTNTRLGQRLVKKANRGALRLGKPTQAGGTGGSALNPNKAFKEATVKKRFKGRTS
jgi:hypothetical protein